MQITAQEEYGLRCIVQVARQQRDAQVTIGAIAEAEGLSKQYVAKLLHRLHRAGLITSCRGLHGGYRLARLAHQISIAEIMDAMGGLVQTRRRRKAFCETYVGKRPQCVHLSNCSVRPMWLVLMRHITEILHTLTLHDLLNEETLATQKIEQYFGRLGEQSLERAAVGGTHQ